MFPNISLISRVSEELGPADLEDLSCGLFALSEVPGSHEDHILYRGAGHYPKNPFSS